MLFLKFPAYLKRALKENNVTQQKLANALGTTQATVNRWLKGVNEPDLETLIRICLFLDETPNAILGFDDITESEKKTVYISNSFNNNSGNIHFKA